MLLAEHEAAVRRERVLFGTAMLSVCVLGLAYQAPALIITAQGAQNLATHAESPSRWPFVRAVVTGLHQVGDAHYRRDFFMRDIRHLWLNATLLPDPDERHVELATTHVLLRVRAERFTPKFAAAKSLRVYGWAVPPNDGDSGGTLRIDATPLPASRIGASATALRVDCTFAPLRFIAMFITVAFACIYALCRQYRRPKGEVQRALEECGRAVGMSAEAVRAAIEAEVADTDTEAGLVFDATYRNCRVVVTRSWLVVLRRFSFQPVDVVQIGQVLDHQVRRHDEFVGNNVRVELATLTVYTRRPPQPAGQPRDGRGGGRRGGGGNGRTGDDRAGGGRAGGGRAGGGAGIGHVKLTLPRDAFEQMRVGFLARLSEAQLAIRRQRQHAALELFRLAVAVNGAEIEGDAAAAASAVATSPLAPRLAATILAATAVGGGQAATTTTPATATATAAAAATEPDASAAECMGCTAAAEVRIRKRCTPSLTLRCCDDRRDCFCAPAWCRDCLGKWWLSQLPDAAARSIQLMEEDEALATLAAELGATCPTCRVPFCLRDVVPLNASVGVGARGR